MKNASIQLRTINQLLIDTDGRLARYWIPSYQRGYRWTPLQVTQLLDDIWEFIQTREGMPKESFYCLQPLVIKPREDGSFEVVDGQQRLTTLYILLTYLGDMLKMLGKKCYQLHFETRGESSESFLADIKPERAEENVDFFHICAAHRAVEEWFAKRDLMHRLKLLQHLLNDDDIGRNVKVIWFELDEQDDPVAAFTRLNVGKIRLTNDELVRAIFLRRATAEADGKNLALRIAHEWDQLEKSLQQEPFWYFISNTPAPGHNRIGLLFELVATAGLNDLLKQDAYGVFHFFNEKLESGSVEQEWLAVKQTFMALEEWFENRELFHIVGFLIQQNIAIYDLLELAKTMRKSELAHELRCRAFVLTIGVELNDLDEQEIRSSISEYCENLTYGKDSGRIRTLLLLFNLATLLSDPRSNLRFQFDSFKAENWDIEHVRSVYTRRPVRHNERRDWLTHCLGYLSSQKNTEDLMVNINEFLGFPQTYADDNAFEPVYEAVLKYFKEDKEGEKDGLSNLTLLDQSTNRSYKNAVFAVKRQRLLELDKSGIFVPLCTRNVFLKCYSSKADNVLFWGDEDANAYGAVIVDVLTEFFAPNKETIS